MRRMRRPKKQHIDYLIHKSGVQWYMEAPEIGFEMPISIYEGGRQKAIAIIDGKEYDLTEHELTIKMTQY